VDVTSLVVAVLWCESSRWIAVTFSIVWLKMLDSHLKCQSILLSFFSACDLKHCLNWQGVGTKIPATVTKAALALATLGDEIQIE
jgi:hypothetical protein